MYTYHFTKRQAETAARATIVNYSERYPNDWQDEEKLAFDVSALLGIPAEPTYVGAALQSLDDLRLVEANIHPDLATTEAADLVERFEGNLLSDIRDTIHAFPEAGQTVLIPTMELAA